jgi:hypothetical protein
MSRLPDVIFILSLLFVFILGSEPGTLRNPKQNLGVAGKPRFQFHLFTCKSGSPSQDCVFNSTFIHKQKEEECLTSSGIPSKMTGSCSVEYYPSNAILVQILVTDRTFAAHGRQLNNGKDKCLAMNSRPPLIFLRCEPTDPDTEIVFE